MTYEEKGLERAFLSALQKHFKKPGPFLTYIIPAYPVTATRKGHVIPLGQVHEIFVSLATEGEGVALFGPALPPAGVGIGLMDSLAPDFIPRGAFMNTVMQWSDQFSGMPTHIYDAITQQVESSMFNEGWILTGGEELRAQGNYAVTVRWRRRFDLEE